MNNVDFLFKNDDFVNETGSACSVLYHLCVTLPSATYRVRYLDAVYCIIKLIEGTTAELALLRISYYVAAFSPLFTKTGAFWVNLAEKSGHLM